MDVAFQRLTYSNKRSFGIHVGAEDAVMDAYLAARAIKVDDVSRASHPKRVGVLASVPVSLETAITGRVSLRSTQGDGGFWRSALPRLVSL